MSFSQECIFRNESNWRTQVPDKHSNNCKHFNSKTKVCASVLMAQQGLLSLEDNYAFLGSAGYWWPESPGHVGWMSGHVPHLWTPILIYLGSSQSMEDRTACTARILRGRCCWLRLQLHKYYKEVRLLTLGLGYTGPTRGVPVSPGNSSVPNASD